MPMNALVPTRHVFNTLRIAPPVGKSTLELDWQRDHPTVKEAPEIINSNAHSHPPSTYRKHKLCTPQN